MARRQGQREGSGFWDNGPGSTATSVQVCTMKIKHSCCLAQEKAGSGCARCIMPCQVSLPGTSHTCKLPCCCHARRPGRGGRHQARLSRRFGTCPQSGQLSMSSVALVQRRLRSVWRNRFSSTWRGPASLRKDSGGRGLSTSAASGRRSSAAEQAKSGGPQTLRKARAPFHSLTASSTEMPWASRKVTHAGRGRSATTLASP